MHGGGRKGQARRSKKLIFLAYSLSTHPAQVRADLQRYYGLNLDRLGVDFSAFHAGACLSCLPLGSSLLSAMEPRYAWGNTDYLVHGILCALAGKEVPFPWDKSGGIDGVETESLPLDQFQDWYENSTFKEVKEWREIQ